MKPTAMRAGAVLCAVMLGVAPAAWAASPASDPLGDGVEPAALAPAPILLAQADTEAPTAIDQAIGRYSGRNTGERPDPANRWLTPNKLHQYLGLAAIGLAAATVAAVGTAGDSEGSTGGEKDGGLHGALAVATTTAAVGAVVTGIAVHHEDVGLGKPLSDPDNLHMLLTLIGTAGLATATAMEGSGGHSAFGVGGGLAMLAGIKVTW